MRLLTRNVLLCFVCTSPSEVLLGVSQRLGMFAPERAVARSFSTLGLYVCLNELLLGVVAPHSGTNKTCVCVVVHVLYTQYSKK